MMYDVIMHRTQLMLEEWQYEALKARAERSGRSISDIVREILDSHLAPSRTKEDPLFAMESLFDDAQVSGAEHDGVLYGKPKS
jgi:plasmid stability protein